MKQRAKTASYLPLPAPPHGRSVVLALTIGLAIRLALAPFTGQGSDLPTTYNIARYTVDEGANVYVEPYRSLVDIFCYPPLWIYISSLMYLLWKATPFQGGEVFAIKMNPPILLLVNYPMILMLKLPIIAADALVALLLYQVVSEVRGHRAGFTALLIWFFNPVGIAINAMWCAFDVLTALAALLVCVYLYRGSYAKSALLLGISLSIKQHALLFFAPLAAYVLKRCGWRKALSYAALSILVPFLVSLPYLAWDLSAYLQAFSRKSMPPFDEICWGFSSLYFVNHVLWLLGVDIDALYAAIMDVQYYLITIAALSISAFFVLRSDSSLETLLRGCAISTIVFYLTSPLMNSNYLIWLLPFLIAEVFLARRRLLYVLAPLTIVLMFMIFIETIFFRALIVPIYLPHGDAVDAVYHSFEYWYYYPNTDSEWLRGRGLSAFAFSAYCLAYLFALFRELRKKA